MNSGSERQHPKGPSPMTRLMNTASPKLCKCCHEEPQVSPSFLPRAEGCSRLSPNSAAALPKPPSPRSSLHPSLHPGCAALPWPGVAPPASSTPSAPHWGFPPEHPNGTAPSPSQQQCPMGCFTCIRVWGEGEEHHEQQDCPCSEHGGSGRALPCCSASLREPNSKSRQGGAAIYALHSSPVIPFSKNLKKFREKILLNCL